MVGRGPLAFASGDFDESLEASVRAWEVRDPFARVVPRMMERRRLGSLLAEAAQVEVRQAVEAGAVITFSEAQRTEPA